MTYKFLEAASRELSDAVAHYDNQRESLGTEFTREVELAISGIFEFPRAWPKVAKDLRRCTTKRFPYALIYAVEDDEILIIAVMHQHREPTYWTERIESQ